MDWIAKNYYEFCRIKMAVALYMVLASPGLVVMIAGNDAGRITTYAATCAKYAFFK